MRINSNLIILCSWFRLLFLFFIIIFQPCIFQPSSDVCYVLKCWFIWSIHSHSRIYDVHRLHLNQPYTMIKTHCITKLERRTFVFCTISCIDFAVVRACVFMYEAIRAGVREASNGGVMGRAKRGIVIQKSKVHLVIQQFL